MRILAVLLIPLWTLPALAQRLPPTNPVQPRMDIQPSPFEMRPPWAYDPPDTYSDDMRELDQSRRDADRYHRRLMQPYSHDEDDE